MSVKARGWYVSALLLCGFSGWLCDTLVAQEVSKLKPVAVQLSAPEIWHGVIKTPNQWLRTTIYLSLKPDGTLSGYSVSNDQKSAKIPLSSATRENGKWTLELKSVKAKFVGQQDADGNSVEGAFTQNGVDFKLRLERVEALPPLQAKAVYRGELNAFVRKLPMQLRVIEGERVDGKQMVLVDSLSEGFGSFVGTLEAVEEQLVISVPGLSATWKGKASLDDETWKGNWSQGLVPLPLEWKREEHAIDLDVLKKKRPQTPQPPFPYDISEVSWESGGSPNVKLAGTLLIPKGDRLWAAVVLISGSGPQDRDETVAEHKPFLVIADYLARQGIAVLRYDDRGVAKSTGDFEAAVTDDFIADAESAWTFLTKHPQIDAAKIGLLGHSEGSSVAIAVAAKQPNIAFLALMAGAGWNGRKIAVEQTLEMARRQQLPDATLNALRELLEQHSDLVMASSEQTDFETRVNAIVSSFLASAEVPAGAEETSKAALAGRLKQLNNAWYRDFLQRDPSKLLPEVKQPLLGIWGSEDVQVPAIGNRDAMQAALIAPVHPLTKLLILPGLNHLLQPCKTGLVDEYEAIETTISATALAQFAAFILQVAGDR